MWKDEILRNVEFKVNLWGKVLFEGKQNCLLCQRGDLLFYSSKKWIDMKITCNYYRCFPQLCPLSLCSSLFSATCHQKCYLGTVMRKHAHTHSPCYMCAHFCCYKHFLLKPVILGMEKLLLQFLQVKLYLNTQFKKPSSINSYLRIQFSS